LFGLKNWSKVDIIRIVTRPLQADWIRLKIAKEGYRSGQKITEQFELLLLPWLLPWENNWADSSPEDDLQN